MARYQLIKNGVVENSVLWDAPPPANAYPGYTIVASEIATPGWLWDGATFSEPPPAETPEPVPAKVTLFQARTQLRRMGVFATIDAYVEANKAANPEGWEAWNYANDCYRASAFVASLAALLSLTSEQIDAAFIAASKIEV